MPIRTLPYQGQPGEQAAPESEVRGRVTWDQVAGKPAAFPPIAHVHQPQDIDGLNLWILSQAATFLPGATFTAYCRAGVWDLRGWFGMLGGRKEVTFVWVAMAPTDPPPPTTGGAYAIPGHDLYVPVGGTIRIIESDAGPGDIEYDALALAWDVERLVPAGEIEYGPMSLTWDVQRAAPTSIEYTSLALSWDVKRVADASKPKGLLGGTMGRSLSDTLGILDAIVKPGIISASRPRSTVIEVDWDAFQSARGSLVTAKVNALRADIATARTNGLNVFIRPFHGMHAPTWAKDLVGILGFRETAGAEPYWYTNDGADGDDTKPAAPSTRTKPVADRWYPLKKPIPNWTDPLYWQLVREFHELLAAAIGDEPNVVVIAMSLPMTQYAEPCIKQFSLPENRIASLHCWKKVAGAWVEQSGHYTLAGDLASFTEGFDIWNDIWTPRGVATAVAYNPHQSISAADPPGMSSSDDRTLALMDEQIAKFGTKFAILENNSIAALLVSGVWKFEGYAAIYARMKSLHASTGVRLHFQTETKVKHQGKDDPTSPLNTHKLAAEYGAMSVEITRGGHLAAARVDPGVGSGWTAWTTADATAVNNACTANVPAWWS